MQVSSIKTISNPISKIVTNPKVANFAKTTVCAIAVETTLKALGRPAFIYCDKNANKRSKKYAATKEFLYQSFCLGLYLGLIGKFKKKAYKIIRNKFAKNNPEDKRKLDLYDSFQNKIDMEKDKLNKKKLEAEFIHKINTDKDYRLGKGVKELGSIVSTVVILAFCAPILSQMILHPVMDFIFPKNKVTKQVQK